MYPGLFFGVVDFPTDFFTEMFTSLRSDLLGRLGLQPFLDTAEAPLAWQLIAWPSRCWRVSVQPQPSVEAARPANGSPRLWLMHSRLCTLKL